MSIDPQFQTTNAPKQYGGVLVLKADGTSEPFDQSKLQGSLERAGASKNAIEEVLARIEKELVSGVTTSQIYRHAFSMLSKIEKPAANRYSLKRAILDFGPSGFPFEDYIAAVFRKKGYETRTRVMVSGLCARHELDLIATKDGKCIGAEIKFHNDAGLKSDMKIALYIRARFLDILEKKEGRDPLCEITEGWAITNTKFTEEAHSYARCAGLTILDWTHSAGGGNLQDWIEETNSHPLTCLTSLSKQEKVRLLSQGVVLCNVFEDRPGLLTEAGGVPSKKVDSVLREVKNLCIPGR